MRSLVPAFLLFSAITCLTSPVHAANIGDILASIGCDPLPSDSGKRARCDEALRTYCRISPSLANCRGVPTTTMTPARVVAMESNAEAQVAKYCKTPRDIAAKCCATDTTNCQSEVTGEAKSSIVALLKATTDSDGLNNDCNQSEVINGHGAKATYGVAGVCDSAQKVCTDECAKLVDELTACVSAATPSNPLFKCQAALKVARESVKDCQGLNSSALVASAEQYAGGETMAAVCGSVTKETGSPSGSDGGSPAAGGSPADIADGSPSKLNISSMMPMLQNMLPALMQALQKPEGPMLDRVDCSVNPNLAGCLQGKGLTESWNEKTGLAEASVNPAEQGAFDLPDPSGSFDPQSTVPTGAPSSPPTVGAVPNGGGGIPGGGGGGPASLGGGVGSGSGAQLGSKTDVLHGVGSAASGGYSQTNAGINVKSGENGGYSYGSGVGADSGMNLGDFLPGGRQDPSKRALAGQAMTGNSHFQIQAKDVNIWNRISERIKSRCSQGLLRDCIP